MQKTATLYTIGELTNPEAKRKALRWASEHLVDEWWESTYYDAEQVGCKITGFDCERGNYCKLRLEWDALSVALRIREEHGDMCDTHKAAMVFIAAHDEYHGVNGKITLADKEMQERSRHQQGQDDVAYNTLANLEAEWEEKEAEFIKALSAAYLAMLKSECEYVFSDEYLTESLDVNEYTFTKDGIRVNADKPAQS